MSSWKMKSPSIRIPVVIEEKRYEEILASVGELIYEWKASSSRKNLGQSIGRSTKGDARNG